MKAKRGGKATERGWRLDRMVPRKNETLKYFKKRKANSICALDRMLWQHCGRWLEGPDRRSVAVTQVI